jgi:hypothetical protein
MNPTDGVKEKGAKRKVHRSPNYPSMGLKEALEKARLIYDAEKRSFGSPDVLRADMGYTAGTGPAGRALSALKQYGLIDEKDGQYRISDGAFALLELSHGSEEYRSALKEAALRPAIFNELIGHYAGNIPSDTNLRDYLLRVKKFNPAAVADFIRIFRETVELAKEADLGNDGIPEEEPFGAPQGMDSSDSQRHAVSEGKSTDLPYFRFSLNGATVEFRASAPLSPEHFALIEAHLNALKSIKGGKKNGE